MKKYIIPQSQTSVLIVRPNVKHIYDGKLEIILSCFNVFQICNGCFNYIMNEIISVCFDTFLTHAIKRELKCSLQSVNCLKVSQIPRAIYSLLRQSINSEQRAILKVLFAIFTDTYSKLPFDGFGMYVRVFNMEIIYIIAQLKSVHVKLTPIQCYVHSKINIRQCISEFYPN